MPDLFQLPVEGENGKKLWVLEADMGSGSVAGGSGGEYFVGNFDGTKFTAMQDAKWVDYGRDFYAPISWSNIPKSDGRRMWIGWFNNWQTHLVPTFPWRSCLSIPRTLSLRKVTSETGKTSEYVMVQTPVREFSKLRSQARLLEVGKAAWPPVAVTHRGEISDITFELETILKPGTARSVGFRIRTGDSEYTEVGYDRKDQTVYVDRRHSGNVDFHAAFAGRHDAPARVTDGKLALRIMVDRSSIEVFINNGEAVISDRIFPSSNQPTIEAFAGDASAKIGKTTLYMLNSIWGVDSAGQ